MMCKTELSSVYITRCKFCLRKRLVLSRQPPRRWVCLPACVFDHSSITHTHTHMCARVFVRVRACPLGIAVYPCMCGVL